MNKQSVKLKSLILDIETSPHIVYTYDLWGKSFYTAPDRVIKESQMLSWSAKFIGEKKVHFMDARSVPEEILILAIVELMRKADIVVAHNGNAFDIKVINDRAGFYGIPLPTGYRAVDTFKISKKYARTPYHNLKYLCERYNKKHFKMEHGLGIQLGIGCMNGDIKMWKINKKYNIDDVLALEELYVNTLQAWDIATLNWIRVQQKKKNKS